MTPILILLCVSVSFGQFVEASSPQRPRRCPKGQSLECATDCGRKCADYFNPPDEPCEEINCIWATCVCDPTQGWFLNGTECIPKELCPRPTTKRQARRCPRGQEDVCDTNCNRTCADYFSPQKECPRINCVTTACMCDPKQGHYLNENTNKCVHYTQCPNPYMYD